MTASTEVKAVMVMVSGHGQQILVVVEDGHFFDAGLKDLGRRTGLSYALELFCPSSYSPSSPFLPIILVVVEDGLGGMTIVPVWFGETMS